MAQLTEAAVRHDGHLGWEGAADPPVPRQPDERSHRADVAHLVEQRVDEGCRLGTRLAPPDSRPGADVRPQVDHESIRCTRVAVPRPPPQHMVTSPSSASRRSSSATIVAMSLPPVAPTGWPSAIAPPL